MPQIDLWYWIVPQSDPFVRRALSGGSHGTPLDYNGRYARALAAEGDTTPAFAYFLLSSGNNQYGDKHLHDIWRISPDQIWLTHDGQGKGVGDNLICTCPPGQENCDLPLYSPGQERRHYAANWDWRGLNVCPRFIEYCGDGRDSLYYSGVTGHNISYGISDGNCCEKRDLGYGPVNIRVRTWYRDWGYDIGLRRTVEIRFEGASPWEIYHFVEGVGCTQYHHENPNDMTAVWAVPWGGGNFGRVNCCQFGNIGD